MVEKDSGINTFLLKLVDDISTIRATVGKLEDQFEKLESRLLDPFQETRIDVNDLKRNIKDANENIADLQKTIEDQQAAIAKNSARLDKYVWYVTGIVLGVTTIAGIIYQLVSLAM